MGKAGVHVSEPCEVDVVGVVQRKRGRGGPVFPGLCSSFSPSWWQGCFPL